MESLRRLLRPFVRIAGLLPSGPEPAAGAEPPGRRHLIVVLNFPVPDDRRVWAEAVALRDAGGVVSVVCPALRGRRPGKRVIDGVHVWYFPTFEGRRFATTAVEGAWTTAVGGWLAVYVSIRMTVRTVQVCNPPDSLAWLLRIARRRGARTLYDQHDVVPVLAAQKPGARRLVRAFEAMEGATVRAADVVITSSEEQRQRIHRLYGRECSVVRTAPFEARDRPTSPRQALVLGYLGVIGYHDGVDDLVRAVADARRRTEREFVVHVAGDGPALASAQALTHELGVADVLHFVGWLDTAGIERFLGEVSAMLVPDPPNEFNHYCAMNKVTHAMAAGVPLVYRPLRENLRLTRGGGFVADGDAVDDFADAIVRFLEAGDDEHRAVGEQLRLHFAEDLDWDAHRRRYLHAVQGPAPDHRTAGEARPSR